MQTSRNETRSVTSTNRCIIPTKSMYNYRQAQTERTITSATVGKENGSCMYTCM